VGEATASAFLMAAAPYGTPSEAGSDYPASANASQHGNDGSPAHVSANADAVDTESSQGGVGGSELGNSVFYDDPDLIDGSFGQGGVDPASTQKAIDQVQSKIERMKEMIQAEQTSRDEAVNEYLKLSSNADRQQQARIKQVFEKKNQKSAQSMAHYSRKLEDYHKKLQDLQEHGVQRPRQTHKILGQGLKSVGGNIRDGLTGAINKPKELAAHLIRQKHKFGSADNLSHHIGKEGNGGGGGSAGSNSSRDVTGGKKHGSASLPRENSGLSGGGTGAGGSERHSSLASSNNKRKCISDDGRRSERSESGLTTSSEEPPLPPSMLTAPRQPSAVPSAVGEDGDGDEEHQEEGQPGEPTSQSSEWKAVMQELVLHREEVEHLREEMEDQRSMYKAELEALTYQLREERDRCERLEEQMNDLTELHQHEIENIKSMCGDMEEKVRQRRSR